MTQLQTAPLRRRLVQLAGARLFAQVLSVTFFVIAARALSREEFGYVGGALVMMVVVGGLGDLGTSRSIVRMTVGQTDLAWSAYVRCASVRLAGGLVTGAIAIALLAAAPSGFPVAYGALGATIAIFSGIAEVGFGSLRSLSLARREVQIVVAERLLFVASGLAAVALGYGATGVLAAYALTNAFSAGVVTSVVRRAAGRGRSVGLQLFDREGRSTALATALAIALPRTAPLVLVFFADPSAVAQFVFAMRLPETIGVLIATMLAPLLPALRSPGSELDGALAAATRAALMVLVPATAFFLVAPQPLLSLAFGSSAADHTALPLRILALWMICYVARTGNELIAVATGQSARLAIALAVGLAVVLAISVLGVSGGAATAAIATLAGEFAVLVVLGRQRVPRLKALAGDYADVRAEVGRNIVRHAIEPLENR